jgi:hypothetical protein
VKIALRQDGSLDCYRMYVIARYHFSGRSGLFSIDELCDVLHQQYGYRSLHKRPGNGRRDFIRKWYPALSGSVFFRQASDGRLITVSERKLLVKYHDTTKSGWFQVPPRYLMSKGEFFDFCVGIMVAGNRFRCNGNIARQFNCTKRRIQTATSRNHKSGIVLKQFNFINDISGSYKEIERTRAALFNDHKISSPRPIRRNSKWILRLNAPNSYHCFVLSGVKGDRAQPTGQKVRKQEKCWFEPIREKKQTQLDLFKPGIHKNWLFNPSEYTLGDYICDHSSIL